VPAGAFSRGKRACTVVRRGVTGETVGFPRCYLAKSIALDSLMTVTLTCPG
jgi:hypothetical protein